MVNADRGCGQATDALETARLNVQSVLSEIGVRLNSKLARTVPLRQLKLQSPYRYQTQAR
jgi:hypothetical protein